jgi:hypothetical protein
MSNHSDEYRELLARTLRRDRDSIVAHWELGQLFARYGESVTDIAMAIERSVTYVADHVAIAKRIETSEALDAILDERDEIQTWTVLVDWVKAGGPPVDQDGDPDANDISRQRRQRPGQGQTGGLQLTVPSHVVKALADMGLNAREALALFWQNASPNLIMNVAYPDRAVFSGHQDESAAAAAM